MPSPCAAQLRPEPHAVELGDAVGSRKLQSIMKNRNLVCLGIALEEIIKSACTKCAVFIFKVGLIFNFNPWKSPAINDMLTFIGK